jgi:hypothetical protein
MLMMELGPWRRPKILSKLAKAASRSGAALAWPLNFKREPTHCPEPERRKSPDKVSSVSCASAAWASVAVGIPASTKRYVPKGLRVDKREPTSSASSCSCPASCTRPPSHSTERPCVLSNNCPSSNTVFQGVPKPDKTCAGHCELPSCSVTLAPLSESLTWPPSGALVQQSANSVRPRPRQLGDSVQCTRPGRAAASRLCTPPVSSRRAEPFHTVPVGACNTTRSPEALPTAAATQLAGAKNSRAKRRPRQAPQKAGHQGAPAAVRAPTRLAVRSAARPLASGKRVAVNFMNSRAWCAVSERATPPPPHRPSRWWFASGACR